jgi:hypothetical protein
MKSRRLVTFFLAAALLALAAGAVVLAQTSTGFDLSWHVVGSGGGESGSAGYQVQGTMGQAITSPPTSDSPGFVVSSGYWVGSLAVGGTTVYLPLIVDQ